MSDPHEQGGISVTIKGDEPGGKYNDPKSPGTWIVFHGTPDKVREQICQVFTLELDINRPLFDLVNEATKLFKGAGNVSQILGGTVLSSGSGGAPASSGGDVWSQVNQAAGEQPAQPPKEDVDPILVAIDNAKTVEELKQLWAENQAAFNDSKYMDPWKAKGKALTGK